MVTVSCADLLRSRASQLHAFSAQGGLPGGGGSPLPLHRGAESEVMVESWVHVGIRAPVASEPLGPDLQRAFWSWNTSSEPSRGPRPGLAFKGLFAQGIFPWIQLP